MMMTEKLNDDDVEILRQYRDDYITDPLILFLSDLLFLLPVDHLHCELVSIGNRNNRSDRNNKIRILFLTTHRETVFLLVQEFTLDNPTSSTTVTWCSTPIIVTSNLKSTTSYPSLCHCVSI